MRFWSVIFLLVLVSFSCKKKSEYEGYSLTDTGLNYKIHTIGLPDQLPQDSDIVTVNIVVSTLEDSVIYESERTVLYKVLSDTSLNEFLGLLAVGDSASAILDSKKIESLGVQHPAKAVKVHVVIGSSQPYKKWAFYQKYPELLIDLEIEEQVQLQRILNMFEEDSIQCYQGVFVVHKIVGAGSFPQSGDEVAVNYEVYTSAHKLIDSTIERNQPFSYVLGIQDQVLEGFDIGVRKMKMGGKATLIVPSSKAFGAKGSSTGLAQGYETLVFEVELISISAKK